MTTTQFLIILISAAVTNNILLMKFMGMCSYLAISRNLRTALGLGLAVLFVSTATAPINHLIDTEFLQPRPYLETVSETQAWAVKEDSPIAKSKLVVEKPSFIQEDAQEAWKKQGEEFYKNAIAKGALDASAPHSVVAEVDRANYVAPAGKALVEVTVNKLEERNTPDLGFLRFIVYIMVIAGFVQLVEMIIERFSPVLHINLGIYLPLITVNCAILGASMDMGSDLHGVASTTVLSSATYGLACGLGWMIVILLMAGIRSRLDSKSIPRPMRGLGVTLVVTGLMAMAFMGFKGVDKNLKDTQVSPDAEVAEAPKTPETEAPKAETPKAESKKGGQA